MKTLLVLSMVFGAMLIWRANALLATGTVNGSVVDSDGKALPNQKVRIKKVLSQTDRQRQQRHSKARGQSHGRVAHHRQGRQVHAGSRSRRILGQAEAKRSAMTKKNSR